MVAKGLDVAEVDLVGVVWADQQMAFPDFRAEEKTFQLLTQVAGRAGRGIRDPPSFSSPWRTISSASLPRPG